jgi:hypothetical protein
MGAAMTDVDRSDEYLEWLAEDERREEAVRNGQHPDDTGPAEPPDDSGTAAQSGTDEPTTWEPVDLGPYLRGEVERPQPALGVMRADGLRLIYPGRQHVIVGETESGKTWFALACVAAELAAGRCVAYVHFEESDPGSTLDRLQLLGTGERDLVERFRFVGPARPIRKGWLDPLLTPVPSLVVFDGVNEGMALHGADIMPPTARRRFGDNSSSPSSLWVRPPSRVTTPRTAAGWPSTGRSTRATPSTAPESTWRTSNRSAVDYAADPMCS